MTNTPKHTPTPWKFNEKNGLCYEIVTLGGAGIASVMASMHHPEAIANAELIVRAVNAHEELVNALDECYGELLADSHRDGARLALLSTIENALRKAGVQS